MTSPLEQCRDALDWLIGDALRILGGTPVRNFDETICAARAARAAADAALAAQPEPIAWAQLGMRNGHTYVRMNYEGHLYPPPADVQRNLNLTPLYAAPKVAQGEPPAANACRIELVTALHSLASDFENSLHRLDPEARRIASGSIGHAMTIAARWNWNGDWALDAPKAARVEPAVWVLREALEKRETTARGNLWFTDPQNTAWAPLYAAPKAAQCEPVAWMTEAADGTMMLWPTRAEACQYCDDDEQPTPLYAAPKEPA